MKQTLVTIFALALLLSAVTEFRLCDVGIASAKPTTIAISVSNSYSSPPSPEDMGKALHEAFQASKPYILKQMEQDAIRRGVCPPKLKILSIAENQTFNTRNITLSFSVSEPADFAYSLNGQENTTIEGNTTLTGLSVGPQSIVVYATDIFGKSGASETVNFTVTQPKEPEFVGVVASSAAEPFPPVYLVVVVGVCVVSGVSGFIVYRRKRSNDMIRF